MDRLHAKSYALQLAKVIAADDAITREELRRIYEVMAALETGPDSRMEILELLYFNPQKLSVIELEPSVLDDDDLRMGLAKDVLFLESQKKNDATTQLVQSILDRLRITPQQTEFLRAWVAWENKALRRLGAGESDLADEKSVKELASRAAAVGVPLTALYFAGVVGFSAAGITSGLATIGTASGLALLGLNPMTAGIAALIVAGVSIKKICDFALKVGKKEVAAALEKAKDVQQLYRTYLLQDLTEFEKRAIREGLAGKETKTIEAIESLRYLLSESIAEKKIGQTH